MITLSLSECKSNPFSEFTTVMSRVKELKWKKHHKRTEIMKVLNKTESKFRKSFYTKKRVYRIVYKVPWSD